MQENVTDVLCPEAVKLELREDLMNGVYVEGLSEEVVTSGESTIHLLQTNIMCTAPTQAMLHACLMRMYLPEGTMSDMPESCECICQCSGKMYRPRVACKRCLQQW